MAEEAKNLFDEAFERWLPAAKRELEIAESMERQWRVKADDLRRQIEQFNRQRAPETPQDRRSWVSGHGEPPDTPTGDTRG